VRLVVIRGQELDWVGRDDRQPQRIRELDGGRDMRLVVRQAGALQLKIKALRKDRVDAPRDRLGPHQVAVQQCLPDRAFSRTGQDDQPFVQLDQPRPLQPGLAALRVVQPAAGQQLAQDDGSPGGSAPARRSGSARARRRPGSSQRSAPTIGLTPARRAAP
jgi:hypothetical protein